MHVAAGMDCKLPVEDISGSIHDIRRTCLNSITSRTTLLPPPCCDHCWAPARVPPRLVTLSASVNCERESCYAIAMIPL